MRFSEKCNRLTDSLGQTQRILEREILGGGFDPLIGLLDFCNSFFKECPHPDDKQRKDLGRRLTLEPLQVKFWFQNKRTQMKV